MVTVSYGMAKSSSNLSVDIQKHFAFNDIKYTLKKRPRELTERTTERMKTNRKRETIKII